MQNTIVTVPESVTPEAVEGARRAFVDSVTSNYGAGRRYAAHLVAFLGTAWITLAHDAKGPEGDAMRAERDALYEALRAGGHSNPSVKWKQIKGYALELTKPEAPEGEGEGEGTEGEGKGKRETRSVQLRMIEDLAGLYKMCKRETRTLTDEQRKASVFVASALRELGVDISTL